MADTDKCNIILNLQNSGGATDKRNIISFDSASGLLLYRANFGITGNLNIVRYYSVTYGMIPPGTYPEILLYLSPNGREILSSSLTLPAVSLPHDTQVDHRAMTSQELSGGILLYDFLLSYFPNVYVTRAQIQAKLDELYPPVIKFITVNNPDFVTGMPILNNQYSVPQTFNLVPPSGKNITSVKLNGVEKLSSSVASYNLTVSTSGDYSLVVASQAMLPLATNCKLRTSFIPQGAVDESLGNVTYKLGDVKALAIGSILEVNGVTPVNFPYTSRMDVLFYDANGVPAYFNGRIVLTPVDDNGSEIVDVYPFFNNQSKAPMVFNGSLFKAEKTKQFSWQCPATYIDIAGGSPPKWRFKIVELESVPLETEIPETGVDPEFPVTETQPYFPPEPNDPVEPGDDVTVIEITINQPSTYPQGNTYKEITDVLEVGFKDIVAAINTHETQVYEGFAKLVVVLNQIKNALPLVTVNLENTLKTSLAEINNQLISVNVYLNAIQLQQQIQNSDDDTPDLTELIEELKKIREALYTAPSVGDPETIAQLQAGILTAWSENG